MKIGWEVETDNETFLKIFKHNASGNRKCNFIVCIISIENDNQNNMSKNQN